MPIDIAVFDTGAPPYLVFIVQEYNISILNCFVHYVKYNQGVSAGFGGKQRLWDSVRAITNLSVDYSPSITRRIAS